MTERAPSPELRSAYRHFRAVPTRWMDNDVYGHVNNVQYYSFFDTVVNGYLIEQGALDPHGGAVIGLVVETKCNYFASLSFPETIDAGLRVARIGGSSVRYEIGLFRSGADARRGPGPFHPRLCGARDAAAGAAARDDFRRALEPLAVG